MTNLINEQWITMTQPLERVPLGSIFLVSEVFAETEWKYEFDVFSSDKFFSTVLIISVQAPPAVSTNQTQFRLKVKVPKLRSREIKLNCI